MYVGQLGDGLLGIDDFVEVFVFHAIELFAQGNNQAGRCQKSRVRARTRPERVALSKTRQNHVTAAEATADDVL